MHFCIILDSRFCFCYRK